MEWPASLDEYEKFLIRMNTPRVVIDNTVCATATLVKVDSTRNDMILLEAVQILTDLDLSITKAYISSDGSWFMNVFHVTDRYNQKVTDKRIIAYIERSLSAEDEEQTSGSRNPETFTALELVGTDRPGLLSEIFAVLANLGCSVAEAKLWAHQGRIAALLFVEEEDSGLRVENSDKISRIENRLGNVVCGVTTSLSSYSSVFRGSNADRRLHQLMFADRDYERASGESGEGVFVSVQNWIERGYSIVNVNCSDRPKLLFDVLCTLTDLAYVVFHGTIDTTGDLAYQEFYIRRSDGSPICSEAERQRVVLCLQAGIERRASEGLRLELCTADPLTLAEAPRMFRENGLTVRRAEMSTKGEAAVNVFYVADAGGHRPGRKTIEAVMERFGDDLKACEDRPWRTGQRTPGSVRDEPAAGGGGLLRLGSLVLRNLSNLNLNRSL